jgi:hypothetical protein
LEVHLRKLLRVLMACTFLCEVSRQHEPLHALGILVRKVLKREAAVLIGLLDEQYRFECKIMK